VKRAFSLIGLIIVAAILGIMAAIAVTTFQSYTLQAKAAVAKDSLRMLRNAIELYTAQHDGVPPGLAGGTVTSFESLELQMKYTTDIGGQSGGTTTKGGQFLFGPFLSEMPKNPFNDKIAFLMIGNNESFPESATGDYGWVYQPATKNIRLDWPGTDKDGIRYFNY